MIALGIASGGERAFAQTPLWTIGGALLLDESLHAASRRLVDEVPALETVGDLLEVIGGPYGVAAATAAIWLVDRETAQRSAQAVAATSVVTIAIKILTDRARPDGAGDRDPKGIPLFPNLRDSFPSGHSSVAFAFATVVADSYPKWREEAYGIAALIALSRVLIGRHWISDVVAGAWLGHGIASATVVGAPIWSWQW